MSSQTEHSNILRKQCGACNQCATLLLTGSLDTEVDKIESESETSSSCCPERCCICLGVLSCSHLRNQTLDALRASLEPYGTLQPQNDQRTEADSHKKEETTLDKEEKEDANDSKIIRQNARQLAAEAPTISIPTTIMMRAYAASCYLQLKTKTNPSKPLTLTPPETFYGKVKSVVKARIVAHLRTMIEKANETTYSNSAVSTENAKHKSETQPPATTHNENNHNKHKNHSFEDGKMNLHILYTHNVGFPHILPCRGWDTHSKKRQRGGRRRRPGCNTHNPYPTPRQGGDPRSNLEMKVRSQQWSTLKKQEKLEQQQKQEQEKEGQEVETPIKNVDESQPKELSSENDSSDGTNTRKRKANGFSSFPSTPKMTASLTSMASTAPELYNCYPSQQTVEKAITSDKGKSEETKKVLAAWMEVLVASSSSSSCLEDASPDKKKEKLQGENLEGKVKKEDETGLSATASSSCSKTNKKISCFPYCCHVDTTAWRLPFCIRGRYTKSRRDVAQTPFFVKEEVSTQNEKDEEKEKEKVKVEKEMEKKKDEAKKEDETDDHKDNSNTNTTTEKKDNPTEKQQDNRDNKNQHNGGKKRRQFVRKGISSVEERICPIVSQACGGISTLNNMDNDTGNNDAASTTTGGGILYGFCKFHASGREDMDVRMMTPYHAKGGRPFVCKVMDGWKVPDEEELRKAVCELNQIKHGEAIWQNSFYGKNSAGGVGVDGFSLTHSRHFGQLQSSTEQKN